MKFYVKTLTGKLKCVTFDNGLPKKFKDFLDEVLKCFGINYTENDCHRASISTAIEFDEFCNDCPKGATEITGNNYADFIEFFGKEGKDGGELYLVLRSLEKSDVENNTEKQQNFESPETEDVSGETVGGKKSGKCQTNKRTVHVTIGRYVYYINFEKGFPLKFEEFSYTLAEQLYKEAKKAGNSIADFPLMLFTEQDEKEQLGSDNYEKFTTQYDENNEKSYSLCLISPKDCSSDPKVGSLKKCKTIGEVLGEETLLRFCYEEEKLNQLKYGKERINFFSGEKPRTNTAQIQILK